MSCPYFVVGKIKTWKPYGFSVSAGTRIWLLILSVILFPICDRIEHLWGDIPCPRAEKPQKGGRRGETTFSIKPHTFQRCLEGWNKPCVHQDPDTPQRLSKNCVWVSPAEVWVSSGLPQGQGLWVQQTWVWHKPSWRRSPLTSPQGHQNLHKTGETDSWRAQTKHCVHQRPHKRLTQTCL